MQKPNFAPLQISVKPDVMAPGGTVEIRLDLTAEEIDSLRRKTSTVTFAAMPPSVAPEPDPTGEPHVFTWPPQANRLNPQPGSYFLTAEYTDGKRVRCGVARIFVLLSAGEPVPMQINVEPCVRAGCPVKLELVDFKDNVATLKDAGVRVIWKDGTGRTIPSDPDSLTGMWSTADLRAGRYTISSELVDEEDRVLTGPSERLMKAVRDTQVQPPPLSSGDTVRVALQRSESIPSDDQGLWAAIRTHANAISFGGLGVKGTGRVLRGYQGFIEKVLCGGVAPTWDDACSPAPDMTSIGRAKQLPMHGMAAYELLKTATEIFLLLNCGVVVRGTDALGVPVSTDNEERARSGLDLAQAQTTLENYLDPKSSAVMQGFVTVLGTHRLPYIQRVVQTTFPDYVSLNKGGAGWPRTNNPVYDGSVFCTGVLTPRADCVCLIELIWSYWHEEGMLVQAMSAISQRFQNVRGLGDREPLAHVTIDPLRPLNNLLWGYVQDEQNRLTVQRRAAEYDHEYGITLRGKAVPAMRLADSRSKFLEGFHNLLHLCSIFYKEDNDTTVIADGFPLLNALKEVHLLLAQGAHNQFGDLPWTARVEMLMQQWLLARPEMRDFLQSRPMVPYTEAWMPQVDTMKALQGWSDVTVTHFRDLGVFGEQIVLSIRYGDWIGINDENNAKNWARYWRPEIQSYIHAYRTVTGVDLTNADTVDYTMPALHLQKRLALQRAR